MYPPLSIQLIRTLQRGRQILSDEAFSEMRAYVWSQRTNEVEFRNRGGQPDLYYTFFGWMLCMVLNLRTDAQKRKAVLDAIEPSTLDNLHQTVYALCQQLHRTMKYGMMAWRPSVERMLQQFLTSYQQQGSRTSLNANAITLTRYYNLVEANQILALQQPTGGFLAHAEAPIPDMLSTAVALFVLSIHRVEPDYNPTPFLYSHWLPDGGFAPTLFDSQSDVEYVFYGLLAIGAYSIWDKWDKN